MATAKQLVKITAYLTGERRNRVNALAREMINSGLLPISVGRDIKQVPPASAALLLFAVAFSEKAAVDHLARQRVHAVAPFACKIRNDFYGLFGCGHIILARL